MLCFPTEMRKIVSVQMFKIIPLLKKVDTMAEAERGQIYILLLFQLVKHALYLEFLEAEQILLISPLGFEADVLSERAY